METKRLNKRSYEVETQVGTFRRNKADLIKGTATTKASRAKPCTGSDTGKGKKLHPTRHQRHLQPVSHKANSKQHLLLLHSVLRKKPKKLNTEHSMETGLDE